MKNKFSVKGMLKPMPKKKGSMKGYTEAMMKKGGKTGNRMCGK